MTKQETGWESWCLAMGLTVEEVLKVWFQPGCARVLLIIWLLGAQNTFPHQNNALSGGSVAIRGKLTRGKARINSMFQCCLMNQSLLGYPQERGNTCDGLEGGERLDFSTSPGLRAVTWNTYPPFWGSALATP